MASTLNKILFRHVASLTLISGVSLYFVFQELSGSYSELFLPSLKFFGGVFFAGAFVLGMGGALRPALTIGMRLVRGGDFNDSQFRDQLQRLIIFVAEIYSALLGLLLTGFVGIRF